MDLFRSHGIVKEHKNFVQNNYEPWKYEQQFLGYNYRMNEIQAALGISQLKKIKKFVSQRNKIATYYKKKLNNKKIMFQKILDGNKSSYHLMILTLRLDIIKKSYKDIFNYLRKSKIGINLHYYPVHLQPYYLNHCGRLNMKNSENYYKTSFSVPLYYNLKQTDVDYVIKKINNIIE
jgi:dTDP-4-amino-4,6-dideoxygalactose transaminase